MPVGDVVWISVVVVSPRQSSHTWISQSVFKDTRKLSMSTVDVPSSVVVVNRSLSSTPRAPTYRHLWYWLSRSLFASNATTTSYRAALPATMVAGHLGALGARLTVVVQPVERLPQVDHDRRRQRQYGRADVVLVVVARVPVLVGCRQAATGSPAAPSPPNVWHVVAVTSCRRQRSECRSTH